MATVYIEASVSLDGFIAGPSNNGFEHLFAWCRNGDVPTSTANSTRVAYRTSPASAAHVRELNDITGAVVVGRRLFDMTNGWDGNHPMGVPVFVVTHTAPEDRAPTETPFTFVTDGLAAAVALAEEAAGDRAVGVGPGSVAWQALDAGLVDQVRVDLVPVLLGGGTRMFDRLDGAPVHLGDPRVIAGTAVTHLIYDVADRRA
ncbi:dihydrofolate reductase family protein [Streptosporangium sp. DT93]|uniref:dihydrofolate reductase family protein n=1 Tax=Streptosporangium sp. DT93 TaxID=3393428 RepID=UPI003CEF6B38